MDELKDLHNSLNLLVKTSFLVLVGLILSKIFSYIYRIIIARSLGPEIYGLFSLAIMILSLSVAVSSLGLVDGALRFIAIYRGKKEQKKINYIFRFTLITLTISSLVFGILLFLLAETISLKIFHNAELTIFLKFFSLLIPLSVFANFYLALLRSYEKIGWYSFIQNILQTFTQVIFLSIFLFFGLKTNAVIFSSFVGISAMFLATYFLCKYKLTFSFFEVKLGKAEKSKIVFDLISYSWPIIILATIGNLLYWVDSFTIGYFKTATDVGYYNAAVPIASLFAIASGIFMQLFLPLITKEYSRKNFELIKELGKQVGKWVFIINLPLFLIIMLFPGAIINLLFGTSYLVAENALRFLSIGAFSLSIGVISTNLLSMMGKSKMIMFNVTFFVFLNLLLNIIFVPIYGLDGAAFSTMFCTVLSNSILLIQTKYYLNFFPLRRKIVNIFLISLIPLFFLLIIKQFIVINTISLIFSGLTFLLIYLLLVFLTKCLDKNDLFILKGIKNYISKKTN